MHFYCGFEENKRLKYEAVLPVSSQCEILGTIVHVVIADPCTFNLDKSAILSAASEVDKPHCPRVALQKGKVLCQGCATATSLTTAAAAAKKVVFIFPIFPRHAINYTQTGLFECQCFGEQLSSNSANNGRP
jgi:hypothetical protein